MEKYQLLSLVKKLSNHFRAKNPSSLLDELLRDEYITPIVNKMTSEDIIMFCLLMPYYRNGNDIDETYDRIEMNLFSVELVEIYDSEPEVECPTCDGRNVVRCDNCNGNGEVECDVCDGAGDVDCDMCDGLGVDEEDDECPHCDGIGKQSCYNCRGSGWASCDYCGGDGEEYCEECKNGKIISEDKSTVIFENFISWSPKWKDYFFRSTKDEVLDNEDINNFKHNNQTIIISSDEKFSEDYQGYENGDVLLFKTRLKDEIKFNKTQYYIEII